MTKRLVIIFALITLLAFTASDLAAQPKISVQENYFDFGTLKEGESAMHKFEIKNMGSDNLEILRVRTSCGCTASNIEKSVLSAGESTHLVVNYESEKRPGEFEKKIYIYSNDPENPTFMLMISGEIEAGPSARINLQKRMIKLGEIEVAKEYDICLNIENQGVKDLIINKILTQDGATEYYSGDFKIPPHESRELSFKFKIFEKGLFRVIAFVYSNDPYHPTDYIMISGEGK